MKKKRVPMGDHRYRFWMKVSKEGSVPTHRPRLGRCWIWVAGKTSSGYGKFQLEGRARSAHIIAFLWSGGVLAEDGPCVLHACDNKLCVRPSHLFAGSKLDNNQDRAAKGRSCKGRRHPLARNSERVRGENNTGSILTDVAVLHIRNTYYSGRATCRQLASVYAVSVSTVEAVVSGRTWKHLL